MKTVTLARDMRPWRAGDDVPLSDELAATLVASGEATNPRPFPAGSEAADVSAATRRAGYMTRKVR